MAVSSVVTHVGVVLAEVVLVFFSVLSFAIMIERALSLRRKAALEEEDYPPLKEALRSRQADRITARVGASRAPSAAALAAGFSHQDASPERVREVVEQEILLQNAALQHRLRTLATIAATAPYIGLFGTVLGILAAFHKIAVEGQMGASAVAGGITEALVTTALGLGVAVPAVMGYNWLSGLVNDLSLTVETHARDLAAFLPELQTAGIGGNRYEGR